VSTELAGLRDYQQRRLDLADIARALLHLARRHGDSQREADVRSLLARLASGRFQLALAGQFSRGKSTLMNALLGGSYLPMGALPMTSVVTTVRYGSRPRALVRSSVSGLPIEVPVGEISRFVARQSADRTRNRVSSAEVEIPAQFLRLGFEFVDTPGVGSALGAGTAATLQYLPRADALIFVTSFDSALTEAETAFLRTAAEITGRLFVVLNKRDLVSAADAAEVERFTRTWARENLPGPEPQVFGVSALDALTAVTAGAGETTPPAGGVGELRSALTLFLTRERGVVALSNLARAMLRLLDLQERDLRAGLLPAEGDRSKPRIEAELAAAVDAVLERLREQSAVITERAAGCVRALFAERRAAWKDEFVAAVSAQDPARPPASAAWLAQRAGDLQDALISRLAGDVSSIVRRSRSLRTTGAELAGLGPAALGPGDADAGWSADDLPVLPAPVIGWQARPQPHPPRTRRRRGRPGTGADDSAQQLSAATEDAAAQFTDQAEAAFLTLSRRWCAALADQSAARARDDAGQFVKYLRGEPDLAALETVADLRGRTAALLGSLASWAPGESVQEAATPIPVPDPDGIVKCPLCGDLEDVLTALLTQHQYLLASQESEQTRHAQAGGFCPLHTWQYAQLASPVGISAGYAALATTVADAIDRLQAQAGTPRQLGRDLTRLTVCAACAAIDAAEGEAVRSLAPRPAEDMPASLCLRHVALILESGCTPEAAAHLTGSLAGTLRRLAGDMRQYALKREALRRGLITAEEANAYSGVLRLLAGPPALVQPWSDLSSR